MKLKAKIQLRKWQGDAFNLWCESDYKGIFSIVTGGGKTIFGIYCLSHLFQKKVVEKVLIVVPTRTLQDQWVSNLIKYTSISRNEISLSRSKTRKINILTNISSQKLTSKFFSYATALILDECHRYGTTNNVNFLKFPTVSKIGLTATLERKYDDGVSSILKPLIGEVIYDYSIKQALTDGVVEPYKMIYLRTHLDQEEKEEFERLTKKISKIAATLNRSEGSQISGNLDKSLEMLLFRRKRLVNESKQRKYVAARIILDNLNRKKILFCESISQAEQIKRICAEEGLETAIYHSQLKQSVRISILSDFQADFYHTLIGCKALDEGFDVPDIDFGIIVSQTKTDRQRIQRLGRTIRKCENKRKPIIYTLYSTEDEYRALYEEQFHNPEIEVEWKEVI